MNTLSIIFMLFVAALFITGIFGFLFKSRGPWGSYWTFFLVIFLFVWAAALWVDPIGPVYYGVAWVPIIFVGVLITLFLIAATPPYYRDKRSSRIKIEDENIEKRTSPEPAGLFALDIFFWLVIIILVISIIASYS